MLVEGPGGEPGDQVAGKDALVDDRQAHADGVVRRRRVDGDPDAAAVQGALDRSDRPRDRRAVVGVGQHGAIAVEHHDAGVDRVPADLAVALEKGEVGGDVHQAAAQPVFHGHAQGFVLEVDRHLPRVGQVAQVVLALVQEVLDGDRVLGAVLAQLLHQGFLQQHLGLVAGPDQEGQVGDQQGHGEEPRHAPGRGPGIQGRRDGFLAGSVQGRPHRKKAG